MGVLVGSKYTGGEKNDLVGVRFKPCGKIYSFDSGGLDLKIGVKVVVDSMFGLTIGTIITDEVENIHPKRELKSILRKATEEDLKAVEDNRRIETDAENYCLERISIRELPMKLVGTEATLDRKRIVFYFTADGRIDFRELVKDLAAKFRIRIEMRQIGVRDEAKLIGGMGICGRPLCCSTFLTNFEPISIRMAKEQELVLNTSKLSGVCGRLMCCLSYEYDEEVEEEIEGGILKEESFCEKCPPDVFDSSEELLISDTMKPEEIEDVPTIEDVLTVMGEKDMLTENEGIVEGQEKLLSQSDTMIRKEDKSEQKVEAELQPSDKTFEKRSPHTSGVEKKRFKKKKGHSKHKRKKRKKRR